MDFYLAVIRFSHGMSWERYGDFMKQKLFKKLACLALSGILSVSSVEIPAYASERLIMEEKTEIQTETTAEGTTETSGESRETEVVLTETSDESTETEIISTEISDESTETEIISTETSGESRETEVVPTETSDESVESETLEEETTETATDEEITETATEEETTETTTDEETTETETEMVEKMTARAEDGDVPTPQEAYEAMIALQSKFPEGMHWTDASSGTYTWKGEEEKMVRLRPWARAV